MHKNQNYMISGTRVMKKTIVKNAIIFYFFILITILFIGFPVNLYSLNRTIAFNTSFFEDHSANVMIDDILAKPTIYKFVPSDVRIPNFGYTSSAIWFRLEPLKEDYNHELMLVINYPPLDCIQVFYPDVNSEYNVKTTGDLYPFSQRDVLHRNYIFKLPAAGNQPIFIRIKSESQIQLPVNLWQSSAFYAHDRIESIIFGIYFGILMIMALYNLFIYLSTRETAYAFYVLYVVSMFFFQLSQSGFAYEFIWPGCQWWANRSHPFWTSTTTFWGAMFAISFLNIKNISPRLFTAASATTAFLFLLIIASLTVPYPVTVQANTLFVPLTIIFIVCMGLYILRRKFRPARFFIAAWIVYMVFIILHAMNRAGVIPRSFISEYGPYIGSVIEVTMLAFALADRINLMKKEKEDVDRAVLIKQKEQEAVNRELLLARQIQQSLLPGRINLPGEIQVAYKYIPMNTIGGDFLDIHYRESMNDLGLFICDVSGHGVPAALTASMVKMAMNTWPEKLDDPVAMLSLIDESIKDKLAGNFVTAQIAHLDMNTGKLSIAGAGHPPAIIIRRNGLVEEFITRGRFITQAFDMRISFDEQFLERGDKVLLYTDCIIEAQAKGELLGESGFIEFIKTNSSLQPDALCQAVYNFIRSFTGLENLHDDFTILIAGYHGDNDEPDTE